MDIPKEIRTRRAISTGKASIKYPKEFVIKLREEYNVIKNYNKLGRKYDMHPQTIWSLINTRKVFKDA
jgi:Mor family transcriptional regulator